jgi:hypothetical protein
MEVLESLVPLASEKVVIAQEVVGETYRDGVVHVLCHSNRPIVVPPGDSEEPKEIKNQADSRTTGHDTSSETVTFCAVERRNAVVDEALLISEIMNPS